MVKRRTLFAAPALAAAAATAPPLPRPSMKPPRKVIIGTAMKAFWVKHPGVSARLAELTALVDEMARESQRRYGRGLDLAILPETSLSGEANGDALANSVPWAGAMQEAFARTAREHRCYIVAPTYLKEAARRCTNAAVLIDRRGEAVGTYRKMHLVVGADGKTMEGGATPGRENPVFACDFGKLGIQICYDIEFDNGWRDLAAKGAEIIAWPTQSPQTTQPATRAAAGQCYIVSSTWRHNASIFEPTGKIAAQLKAPGQTLVEEIDLSYAILPWSGKLGNGRALTAKYGNRVGFRYYEDEDLGLFWSNDPKLPIRQMFEPLGIVEVDEELNRVREAYRLAGIPSA
ncbi:MAG: carbon-nitrogen hydrolase family protein [Bryobacterales bacterium]|nr:carbon-nitrogen hydrolase family protein [Bryobacterales bacterium]